ncbi:MAG TPA: phage/plasmid primase, P4 family [Candidatus Limnocylindrales bacterium]|nr:phage/plasmid primase, P4 family [Candidatus Limnocylindrales bacterium]
MVDLLTGGLRAATPEDYCTKIAGSAPGGECPRWVEFLDRVTGGNLELQQFLQRMVGYGLTGSTREHSLFFFYGTGANGKSVFLNTIGELLGDYSKVAPVASFTATTTEQHPTDLAGLRGARFVSAIETEDGRWWAEAKIKSLTGGDKITARFMRQDFFEYVPQFKLIVAGNHKPGLRNVDEALRRRLHLVPFVVTIPEGERDPQLCEELRTEFPGILQWAIEGCLAWQRDGLSAPEIVKNATADYLAGEDAIARWLDERCVVDSKCWSSSTALYTDFKGWCQEAGERERTLKAFTQALEDRKFPRERTRVAKGFSNIGLKTDTVPDVPRQPHIPVTRARAYTSYIGGPGTCGTIPRHVPRCAGLPKREDRAPDVAGCVPAETNPADRQDSRDNGAGNVPGASPVLYDAEPEEWLTERRAGSHGPRLN